MSSRDEPGREHMKSNFQRSVMEAVDRHDDRAMGIVEERAAEAPYAEKAWAVVKEIAGHEDEVLPKNRVKLVLGTAERMSLHRQILDRLDAGMPNERIASDVVAYILEFLSDKEKTANTKGAKKGPIFRRSDQ